MNLCEPADNEKLNNTDELCEGIELVEEEITDTEKTDNFEQNNINLKHNNVVNVNINAVTNEVIEPLISVGNVEKLLCGNGFRQDFYIHIDGFEEEYRKVLKLFNREHQKKDRQRRMMKHFEKRVKNNVDENRDKDMKKKKKKTKELKESRKRFLSAVERATSPLPASTITKKKKSFPALTACIICEQPINFTHSGLPVGSIYCSKTCINKQVNIASQCLKDEEHVMLMDLHGMILNESRTPTVNTLEAFLLQYPNFRPVLNTSKLEKMHKKDDEQANKKIESKRMDVRKVIEYQLQQRSKTDQLSYSAKRLKNISAEIEEELFRVHKTLNLKYRTWCKGFINKVKDDANTFFRRVVTEKISVKKLVTMSPEEMFVRIATADGNAGNSENCSPSLKSCPITSQADGNVGFEEHEELVQDSSPPSVSSNHTNSVTDAEHVKLPTIRYSSLLTKYTMVKKKPLLKVEGKSAVDDILGNERDTTGQHNSHLYDANCAICQKKTKLDFAAKERAERMEAKFENKKRFDSPEDGIRRVPRFPNLDSSDRRNDPNTVFPSFTSDRTSSLGEKSQDGEHRRCSLLERLNQATSLCDEDYVADDGCVTLDDDVSSAGFVGRSRDSPERRDRDEKSRDVNWKPNNEDRGWRDSRGKESRARDELLPSKGDVNRFSNSWVRKSSDVDLGTTRITRWSTAERYMQRDENPWHKLSHRVWGGTLQWGRKFQFACTLTALSNRIAFRLGSEMPLVTKVIGRIDPRNVWEYIRTLRDSWTKQVIVLMVDLPMLAESREQFLSCYDEMRRDNRYGVIDCSNHSTIKDGYVFALEPGEPLPKDLYPLEGPGLPEGAEQYGNIIVVIVRKLDRNENFTSGQANESWRKGSGDVRTDDRNDSPTRPSCDGNKSSDGPIRSPSPDNFARYLEATHEFEAISSVYNNSEPSKKTAKSTAESPSPAVASVFAEDESEMLASINNLSDVLAAIERLNKPAQVVLMVGHYINTHHVTEEESEIISRAISMKSETERLRNAKKLPTSRANDVPVGESSKSPPLAGSESPNFGGDSIANTDLISASVKSPEKAPPEKSPAIAGPQHFDIVKLRRPPREIAAERRQKKKASLAESTSTISEPVVLSRSDSGSSADNDSTKAQQISFSADSSSQSTVKALASSLSLSPPATTLPSVSATMPPPPPPSSPPPPPPPPPPPTASNEAPKKPPPTMPPPPAASFPFVFALPPLPIPFHPPPPFPPMHGVINGTPSTVTRATPLPCSNQRDDMDISDTEGNSDNLFTSLLPPPPPPPSLAPKVDEVLPADESFSDDVVVPSFESTSCIMPSFPSKALTGANQQPLGQLLPPGASVVRGLTRGGGRGVGPLRGIERGSIRGAGDNNSYPPLSNILRQAAQRHQQQQAGQLFNNSSKPCFTSPSSFTVPFNTSTQLRSQCPQNLQRPRLHGVIAGRGAIRGGSSVPLDEILMNAIQRQHEQQQSSSFFNANNFRSGPPPPWRPPTSRKF